MNLIRINNTIINADHIREAYIDRDSQDADHVQLILPDPFDIHAVEFHGPEARALITWLTQTAQELPLKE